MQQSVVITLFVVGIGCHHAEDDAQAFRATVDQIWCEAVFTCCAQPKWASVDACVAAVQAGSAYLFAGPDPEPGPSVLVWSQARADACVVQLRAATASCDHLVESVDYFSALCAAAYAPPLATGAPCMGVQGACDLEQEDACLPSGECGPTLDDGQACTSFDECRSLRCSQTCQPEQPVHVWLCGS